MQQRADGHGSQWQELIHGGRYSHSYTEALPDFVALAVAFGWRARRVDRREDLDAAIGQCLECDGPFFLDGTRGLKAPLPRGQAGGTIR